LFIHPWRRVVGGLSKISNHGRIVLRVGRPSRKTELLALSSSSVAQPGDTIVPLKKPVLLVTGFGPFENIQDNPSGDIAECVDGKTIAGVRIIGRRIAVSWREAWEAIRSHAEEFRPQALLCLGVAPDSFIRLEVLAKNACRPCLDIYGEQPSLRSLLCLVEGAPAAYWTTLPVEDLRIRMAERYQQMHARDESRNLVYAELWPDAGWYLCNHVFYHVMHFLPMIPWRGFVHVPRYPVTEEEVWPAREEVVAAGVSLVKAAAGQLVKVRVVSRGNRRSRDSEKASRRRQRG
jgi:pyroglutamyl-peptidase